MDFDDGSRQVSRPVAAGGNGSSLDVLVRPSVPELSRASAEEIVGGLSNTTKMPCHSWGIPADTCRVGSTLEKLAGTVCHDCYALKGAYAWPQVHQAYVRRFEGADHQMWVPAMAELVRWQARRNGEPYFRWFDSGDLQSIPMLQRIADVARLTPETRHWLPTREYATVRGYLSEQKPPKNLTLRISAPLVDGQPPDIEGLATSTVHKRSAPSGYACPAYKNRPATCGKCRACWDPTILNISYPKH